MVITLTPYAQELLKQIAQGKSPDQVLERWLEPLAEHESRGCQAKKSPLEPPLTPPVAKA
jgi:hypothetical protein